MTVKRTIKDSVFRKRFNNKKRLLELYNALEGTDYGEEALVEITTLDHAIYEGVRNDVSFTITGKQAVFIEHQASDPTNMSLRHLVHVLGYYLGEFKLKELHKRVITLPTPSFYLLYNGRTPYPKEQTLKLSNSYLGVKAENSLELKVRMININYGQSDLLEKSKCLKEYAYFVHLIRQFQEEGYEFNEAVKQAIDQCIDEGVMAEFLQKNKQAVSNMECLRTALARSYDEYLEDVRMEGRTEGRAEGEELGIDIGLERGKLEATMEMAKRFLALGNTVDDVARASDLPLDVIQSLVS